MYLPDLCSFLGLISLSRHQASCTSGGACTGCGTTSEPLGITTYLPIYLPD